MATDNMESPGLYSDPPTLQKEAPRLLPLNALHPEITIITHSHPKYATVRQEYNEYNRATVPLAIILPHTVDLLRAAVAYCSSHKPPLAMTVRGGGHDPYGRNVSTTAVQLDLRFLKWTTILSPCPLRDELEPHSVVAVGPGITAMELQQALDVAGLSAATGWVGSVGMTGWSCGGGYGLASGMWGLGADNVVGAKVVIPTPDAEVIDTIEDEQLLWALRGAGLGNFGVISELRVKVYPKPRYLAGIICFAWSCGAEVLAALQALSDEGLPRNLGCELTTNTTERLGPTINLLFTWICSTPSEEHAAEGWAYHDKLLNALGVPVLDTVGETSILEFHQGIHKSLDDAQHGYWTMSSLTVPRLSSGLIDIILDNPAPMGGTSAILIHQAHGRALQSDPTAAWSHRDKHYVVSPCGIAPLDATPEQKDTSKKWADSLYLAVVEAGLTLPKGYWSMSRPDHCDAVKFYGTETVAQLMRSKIRLNPCNAFPAALPDLGGRSSTQNLPLSDKYSHRLDHGSATTSSSLPLRQHREASMTT